MIMPSFGFVSGWVGEAHGGYAKRRCIAKFLYLFWYSVTFRTCCAGWCGGDVARDWMPDLGCRFIPA
jgi:hypothetical protein